MTTGQRIQELRKEKGLSQEALGEALGVSRQAISKWESDISLPEVDKLVALSRLFSVPVGVLLGVEEETEADAETGSEFREFTDREWAAIEEITARYARQAEGPRPRPKRWPLVLAGLAAVLVCWTLFGRIRDLTAQMQNLQNNIYSIENNVSRQLYGMTSQVEELLSKQNSLIADWGYTLTALLPGEDALVLSVRVTPRQHPAELAVEVFGEVDGEIYAAPAAPGDGGVFAAELRVPLSDDIKLSAAFLSGGVRQTQVLETLSGLRAATSLHLWGNFSGSTSMPGPAGNDETVVRWKGEATLDIEAKTPHAGVSLRPVSAEVRIYRNRDLVDSWPLDLTGNSEVKHGSSPVEAAYPDGTVMPLHTGIPFDYDLTVFEGDEIRLTFFVTDNYGRKIEFLENLFSVSRAEHGGLTFGIEPRRSHEQLETPFGE